MRLLALCLLLAPLGARAQVPPVGPAVDARDAAAQGALEALRGQVDARNFRDAGFESSAEVARARLEAGMPVYWGVRGQWARFEPGDGIETVLTRLERSVHLVVVDGRARCVISLEYDDGRWRRESFGSGAFARRLAAAREAASRLAPAAPGSDFLVGITAMRLHLLGRRGPSGTTLTALADGYGLRAMETRPAEEMILHLGAIAKQQLDAESVR